MARTLSSIAARQSEATTKVKEEVKQFLDYCATRPNATVRFLASDMILALHSTEISDIPEGCVLFAPRKARFFLYLATTYWQCRTLCI